MTRYRATVNVTAPLTTAPEDLTRWAEDTYAAMLAKIDRHMIVERSDWHPTGSTGIYVLTFTYTAGQDVEAVAIVHDAAKEAGTAYDAVRVTANGGAREVAPFLTHRNDLEVETVHLPGDEEAR